MRRNQRDREERGKDDKRRQPAPGFFLRLLLLRHGVSLIQAGGTCRGRCSPRSACSAFPATRPAVETSK
ncbi:hypothetical protein PoB_000278900 [Plakobranchus ocellatus]|uniref:Uncharacterized protein n=1 Tax=Plakobranchus ocellatus TaxID=259542 RepID=A0AAV3Y2P3_9GAST|nr:hypothetical protein PoB_000278900 [Plakobranchus ocellatus]